MLAFKLHKICANANFFQILLTSMYISCIIKKVHTSRDGAVGSSLGS